MFNRRAFFKLATALGFYWIPVAKDIAGRCEFQTPTDDLRMGLPTGENNDNHPLVTAKEGRKIWLYWITASRGQTRLLPYGHHTWDEHS